MALCGCNGKTSLLYEVSVALPTCIFGTTTKMRCFAERQLMRYPSYDELVSLEDLNALLARGVVEKTADKNPQMGSNPHGFASHLLVHGPLNEGAKYTSLDQKLLDRLWELTDYPAIFEADGSRTLPLKAWADFEPVIPTQTNVYLGIVPAPVFFEELGSEDVFRYEIFRERHGNFERGQGLARQRELVANMIAHPQGLFVGLTQPNGETDNGMVGTDAHMSAANAGEKPQMVPVLFINKADTLSEEQLSELEDLLRDLKKSLAERLPNLHCLIGSALRGSAYQLD